MQIEVLFNKACKHILKTKYWILKVIQNKAEIIKYKKKNIIKDKILKWSPFPQVSISSSPSSFNVIINTFAHDTEKYPSLHTCSRTRRIVVCKNCRLLLEDSFRQQLAFYKVLIGHFTIVIGIQFVDLFLDFVVNFNSHVCKALQNLFLRCSAVFVVVKLEEYVS